MLTDDRHGASTLNPGDIPVPFAELDADGRIRSCNEALLELIGYVGADLDFVPPLVALIPPRWRSGTGETAGPPTICFRTELTAKHGEKIAVDACVRQVGDDKGRPRRFLACVTLPESDALETSLIEAEKRSSLAYSMLDSIKAPVFAVDDNSRITYANEYAGLLFARPADEVIGMDLWNAYPIARTDLFYRMFKRAMHDQRSLSADHFSPKLNRWYESYFYPRGEDGMVVIMNNVTARKQYERFMGLAAFAIDRISDYVLWVDARGRIMKANDITYKKLDFPHITKGRVHLSRVAAITEEGWTRIWTEIKRKGSLKLETRLVGHDGKTIQADISISYILFVGQEYGCIIARDITDKRIAEQELIKAHEQSELYLDLMSHDIRNINQAGMGFLELALGRTDIGKDEKALLEKPLEAFERSSELIANVKKLQKASGALTLEEIDLDDMLRDLVSRFSGAKGRDVRLEFQSQDGCLVVANPLLREVFVNLIGNAIKHSEGRVHILVRLQKVMVADMLCCEVVVEDDGPGIPDEAKEKLLSMKRLREKGSRYRGLGLILAKSLLDDFNGSITIENRVPGDYTKGARFVVMLPAADKKDRD